MWLLLSEHVQSGGLPLVERHVPVLDPQPPAVYDAVVLGDVACRVYAGCARLQELVGDHTAVRVDSRLLGEPDLRVDACADHHEVTLDLETGIRNDFRHTLAVPLEALELLRRVDLDAVLCQDILEIAADIRAVEALERDSLEHDQLALLSERGERSRELGADVAAADEGDALRLLELFPQRV